MKPFYRYLDATVNFIDKIELSLVVTLMVAICAINGMEIVSRFFLNKSFFSVYEVTILLANWMYFLGACLVYKRRQDVQMEYFMNFFSKSFNKKWDFVIDAAIFYFLIVLLCQGLKLLPVQARHVSQGIGIPNHLFTLPLVVGTISMMLIILQQFLGRCLGIEQKGEMTK